MTSYFIINIIYILPKLTIILDFFDICLITAVLECCFSYKKDGLRLVKLGVVISEYLFKRMGVYNININKNMSKNAIIFKVILPKN